MSKYGKEDDNLEFKREYNKKSLKDIDAFLNTDGGVLLYGVDDDGNPYELEDLNELYNQVTNALRDSFSPDASPYLKAQKVDNEIVKVIITDRENKPYFIRSKGLNSNGVFVRKGVSTYPATFEEIKRMIRNSDGYRFEQIRSPNQDLTFKKTSEIFKERNIEFFPKLVTLGLVQNKTNLYTNLALLLSDQNPISFKVAVFKDDQNTSFIQRKEFKGSILKQINDITEFIYLANRFDFNIEGNTRIEKYDYPEFALREAVVNAITHRDYSLGASNIINVNQNQIEFISLGGLIDGFNEEDILNGVSKTRNPSLAKILLRLGYNESYGTGLRRIFGLYDEVKPSLSITPNSFKLILPNKNKIENKGNKKDSNLSYFKSNQLLDSKKEIINYLKLNGESTSKEIIKTLGIKKSTFYKYINELIELGNVEYKVEKNKRFYKLK